MTNSFTFLYNPYFDWSLCWSLLLGQLFITQCCFVATCGFGRLLTAIGVKPVKSTNSNVNLIDKSESSLTVTVSKATTNKYLIPVSDHLILAIGLRGLLTHFYKLHFVFQEGPKVYAPAHQHDYWDGIWQSFFRQDHSSSASAISAEARLFKTYERSSYLAIFCAVGALFSFLEAAFLHALKVKKMDLIIDIVHHGPEFLLLYYDVSFSTYYSCFYCGFVDLSSVFLTLMSLSRASPTLESAYTQIPILFNGNTNRFAAFQEMLRISFGIMFLIVRIGCWLPITLTAFWPDLVKVAISLIYTNPSTDSADSDSDNTINKYKFYRGLKLSSQSDSESSDNSNSESQWPGGDDTVLRNHLLWCCVINGITNLLFTFLQLFWATKVTRGLYKAAIKILTGGTKKTSKTIDMEKSVSESSSTMTKESKKIIKAE